MSNEKDLSARVQHLEKSLQNEVENSDSLAAKNAELTKEIDGLKAQYETAVNEKQAITEELEKTKEELQDAVTELDAALEANKQLVIAMDDVEQPTSKTQPSTDLAKLSFEKDGVTYGFNFAKITHKKMAISAEEIAVDEKLQDELIALKSGILKVL